jgi:hypothetical protein
MSTHDIPDNELDDFFRKSLEEPEIDFREDDWLQMEKKLDTAVSRKTVLRRYLYSLLALLLGTIISVFLWINYTGADDNNITIPVNLSSQGTYPADNNPQSNNKDNPDRHSPDLSIPEGESIALGDAAEQPADAQKTATVRENNVSERTRVQPADKENEIKTSNKNKTDTATLPVYKSRPERTTGTRVSAIQNGQHVGTEEYGNGPIATLPEPNYESGGRISNKKRLRAYDTPAAGKVKTGAGNKPVNEKQVTDSKPNVIKKDKWGYTAKPVAVMPEEYGVTKTTEVDWPVSHLPQVSVQNLSIDSGLPQKYAEDLQNVVPDNVKPGLPTDSAEVKRLAKERVNYRFKLSLVLSPDLSMVRLSGLTKPGSNVGVILGYQLSRKLSITTGIIRSAKIYDARMEDYSPPPGQWTYYIKPVEIEASCTVLDIPLNVRYNFLMKEKYQLYASGGLSSYLMRSEYYRYIYNVDDTYLRKSWQVDNENKHYFKVYNISAGYERKLTGRLSAGAEPFLKIPGAGVGFGKIRLWSAGIFISANYRLGK